MLERKACGHAQFDLSSECNPAQDAQSGSNTLGPFSHALETPVSTPSPAQLLRIDPAPVVAYGDAQLGGAVFDLCFDVLRL